MQKKRQIIFKLKGIIRDLEPFELMNGAPVDQGSPTPAAWTAGRNVHFDDESTHRSSGYKGFADPMPTGSVPIFQLGVLTPVIAYWIWVDAQNPDEPKIWVTDGSSHFDITPTAGLTGGSVGEWTGCTLNGVPVLNNGKDAPIWWNGATGTPMEILTGWPATMRCRSLRAYKYNLFAMDITLSGVHIPEQIRWSDSADPGTIPTEWEATPSNSAGSTILAATPGGVVDALKLRDSFIIYKQHSTYICSYIAGQYVFSFRSLFTTTGIQSINCVKELRGHHYVFADDDVIRHDGNSFKSIADKQIRQILFRGINPENHHQCHLAIRVPTDEIWVVTPTIDSERCNTAYIYSYTDGVWGIRDLPETAYVADGIVPKEDTDPTWDLSDTLWSTNVTRWDDANYSVTNDRLLMNGPSQGKLYNIDAAYDNDGQPVEAWVERTDWSLEGEPGIWDNKYITAIFPVITGVEGDVVNMRVAGTRSPGAETPWSQEIPYIIGKSLKLDSIVHGRLMSIRFSSNSGSPWELHRVGVEYVNAGQY